MERVARGRHAAQAALILALSNAFALFVLFMSFALNMALQYRRRGSWQSYLFGERVYLLLSLTAKSLLAWQIFFPTLR